MTERQELQHSSRVDHATASQTKTWIDQELAGREFSDARLNKRFKKLFEQLSEGTRENIPLVCQDWANTKAAYRFLSNHRVTEEDILAGHLQSTRDRFAASEAIILILHDTTEFSYHREDIRAINILKKSFTGQYKAGHPQNYTICGILMHSRLAVTTNGLPLGLAAMKFWTRSRFKGCNAFKKKINPTQVPIEKKESIHWLENLKQSTALLSDPHSVVFTWATVRVIFTSFSARQRWQGHIS